MTSYEFYVCKYGGKAVQPDEWQTTYADADALIRRYERLYRVEYPTDSARDTAVCAIADAQRKECAAAHSKVYALPYRRDHQADRRPDRPPRAGDRHRRAAGGLSV